jgi:hypothetical protein
MNGVAQEEVKYPKLNYRGYTKSMVIFVNPDNLDFLQTIHLFHNRSELEARFSNSISLQIHNRNLMYTGNFLLQPDFGKQLEAAATDYADLTLRPIDRGGVKMTNSLDRAFLEGIHGNLEWRIGRQRINWGLHSIWNPNDIFNAYSFVDFDYEERPGADAVLIRYYTGLSSCLQLAYSPDDQWERSTVGILYQFNAATYDLQLLTAYDREYWVSGFAAAGNLGDQAVKVESSLFFPEFDGKTEFSLAASYEGSLQNTGVFYTISYLYDGKNTESGSFQELLQNANQLTARELYPFEHNIMIQALKQFNARFTANVSAVFSRDKARSIYLAPFVSYSLAQNWDLDVFGQVFFEKQDFYRSPNQIVSLRLKWSY